MSKEEILAIADRQMKQGGYSALNFRGISEELGISKANVHHHFKNKENLALAVAEHYAEINYNMLSDIGKETAPSYQNFLIKINELFWDLSKQNDLCSICVCSQIIKNNDNPESLLRTAQDHFAKLQTLFTELAQLAIDNKTIKTSLTAAELAIQTQILMIGIMTVSQSLPDVKSAQKLLGNQANIWLKNLK